MNESCLTYEWVMWSNETCDKKREWGAHAWYHTYARVPWYTHEPTQAPMRRIALMTQSRLTYDWVMSHIWMSHGIQRRKCEAHAWYHTYAWVPWYTHEPTQAPMRGIALIRHARLISHWWRIRVLFMTESRLTYGWAMWYTDKLP